MLEIAIIGGGLCGLALARDLHRQGVDVAVFEARTGLGGRVRSVVCPRSGTAVDLGAAWFWPDTQPLLTGLIADAGLADFEQHDDGTLLHLREADQAAEHLERAGLHGGARRLDHGMAALIEALAAELPQPRLHLDHTLTAVVADRGDHIVLTFSAGSLIAEITAGRVVLAVPPRLLNEHVRFEPDLDAATREAMRGAETWMAAQAKVVVSYDRPFWREAGLSGNAFVDHEQAVLGEIFDACDRAAANAALGAFFALSPQRRRQFGAGLPMLVDSEMVQLFGPALADGEQHYQDWATEPHTCSVLDRSSPGSESLDVASPLLRRPPWQGRLYLGGSETAARGAGFLEGALEAARRIEQAIVRARGTA